MGMSDVYNIHTAKMPSEQMCEFVALVKDFTPGMTIFCWMELSYRYSIIVKMNESPISTAVFVGFDERTFPPTNTLLCVSFHRLESGVCSMYYRTTGSSNSVEGGCQFYCIEQQKAIHLLRILSFSSLLVEKRP